MGSGTQQPKLGYALEVEDPADVEQIITGSGLLAVEGIVEVTVSRGLLSSAERLEELLRWLRGLSGVEELLLGLPDVGTLEEAINIIKMGSELAGRVDVSILVGHLPRGPLDADALDALLSLGEEMLASGIKVCWHAPSGAAFVGEDAAYVLAHHEREAFGVALDVWRLSMTEEALEALVDNLGFIDIVHLAGAAADGRRTHAFAPESVLDAGTILQTLKQLGYDGYIILYYPKEFSACYAEDLQHIMEYFSSPVI